MIPQQSFSLPDEQRLALAYAPVISRGLIGQFMALDARLAGIVRAIREPLLAQMRLAWWRDELDKAPENRAKGDPLLDAISEYWRGEEASLRGLVDGWEELLLEPPLPAAAPLNFAEGRAQAYAAIARLAGVQGTGPEILLAARRWALADLAAKISDPSEKSIVVTAARGIGDAPVKLPRAMRPLAILDGLGRSALRQGGAPLMHGRTDALRAIRLGLFGR